jgi:hypothetical protein
VREDIIDGCISRDAAEREYGVVLNDNDEVGDTQLSTETGRPEMIQGCSTRSRLTDPNMSLHYIQFGPEHVAASRVSRIRQDTSSFPR